MSAPVVATMLFTCNYALFFSLQREYAFCNLILTYPWRIRLITYLKVNFFRLIVLLLNT